MRTYFAPDTLSFPAPHLVEEAAVGFPVIMNIEPTLRCNSDCIMCPRRRSTRPIGDLDLALYKKIVVEMAAEGGVKVLNFHKDGEPLMHPRLEEMIELAMHSGACEFSHFNTNAMLMDETRAGRLLDCGINDITMSIDAVTEKTFARVKRAGSLAAVERNVEQLLNRRERAGLKTPWVRAKLCAMPETQSEIEAFLTRWEGVADEVQVQEVHNYAGGNEGAMTDDGERYPCQCWWASMAVNWDGTVSVCAVDYSGEVLLGDLRKQSIKELFCGDAYGTHRRAMLRGDLSGHATCRRCTVWKVGPDQTRWYRQVREIWPT